MHDWSVRRAAALAGVAALLVCMILTALLPAAWREVARETAFDSVLALDARLRSPLDSATRQQVIVVDIDRASLQRLGPWPWPRATMARLTQAVAAEMPVAIAIDVLFAEADTRSPAALARAFGDATGRSDITAMAGSLPDGDALFAQSIGHVPTVLGFALDADSDAGVRPSPIITRDMPDLGALWRVSGAIAPADSLEAAAAGLGALALPGDADGAVRRVPLLVRIGDGIHAGLAAELVRLSAGASAYLLEGQPLALRIGDARIAMSGDGLLRLAHGALERQKARTLSAADLVEARADGLRLRGALVLIGGSAPELGGLRRTSADALTPSVQIQADAAEQILAGRAPRPFTASGAIGLGIVIFAGLAATIAGAMLAPWFGAAVLGVLIASAWTTAAGLSVFADRLLDPLAPSGAAAVAFAASSIAAFAGTRRREARVRRRFEQHLAPAVVARIVAQPGLLKLGGERREVTALFTDIEGFTALTHRAGPEMLIAVLDGYFEGVAGIVVEHGGMVDKIVGDAVHALFNAPVDLPDHPRHAVDCALAINVWAETYRRAGLPLALELGRTRIGIETGMVVVGDVGVQAKLDYTAHGDAVNMAARLEAANKELGSTICVGPGTVSHCNVTEFRTLGTIIVRGRDEPVQVFTPVGKATHEAMT